MKEQHEATARIRQIPTSKAQHFSNNRLGLSKKVL